ncbi:MAG TPA: hypothetical protein PKE26_01405 [Kiritimatiellia bacterium]|nr:hypothetical protein [Kiritimatiellia bacterium]HMO97749.1 hypothetical protein [Kiritimatiellia bacterium]HMP95388.1 hypothetical protein [Kiritimatiellia bacterium]
MSESVPQSNNGLLRHSIFLFVATQVANIATMLFQVVTGRKLPVDEYGVLAAMMSIFLIAATPLDALRTAMAHFATRAMRTGDTGAIRWLVNTWSRRMVGLALGLVAASYLFRHQAAWFFQLDSGAPFVFACGLIAITFFMPLMTGVFQGMQNFYWMSVSMHTWAILRLILVIVFMTFAPTAIAGLASHAAATSVGLLLSVWGLQRLTRDYPVVRPASGIGGFFLRSLLMLGSYAVLMNADLIFIKHLFTPEEAGTFARAAIIGRSVIFLPMPIALVMFPKVITSGPSTRDSRITLIKALVLVALLIGSAVGAIIAVPWLPLWIMYGIREPDAELVRLLIMVVCAMAPLALTFLLMNYEIAQHRFSLVWLLAGCAWAYIGGVVIWHETMEQIVWVMGSVSLLSAAGFSAAIVWRAGRRRR